MATPNVGILTTTGKALIDKVNSGQAKISFSKVVFSSMDNSQLSDTQIKALTAIAPQEVVVSSPQTTLDTNSGETRIRATGTNEKLADGVYVKTYGVFAKDDAGNEILYGVTVSPNPNYFPAYDGVTPQAVTYSYKTVIQETSNITMTNSNDVYASQEDLTEAIAAIPQPDLSNYATNSQLATKADDSKVVHSTDMRKPASDVAGIDEVNAKQDKIGYTPADDSKVVHTADMRKPASDVAGIEEVNAKQDKIGYTPADDSKVFHSTLTQLNSTDMDTVLNAGFYQSINGTNGIPSGDNWTIYQVIPLSSANGVQVAYGTNNNILGMRSWNYGSTNTFGFTSWVQFADDSKVVHNTGTEEIAGQKTFDVAPIDKTTGNPYITKDGVPSDIARTGQTNTFNLTQTFSQGIKTLQTGSYSDANSLVNEGLYFNTNLSIKNGAGSITAGFIQVLSGYWQRVRQFMYSDVTNNLAYTRVSSDNGSTWSAWVQIITSDNLPSTLADTTKPANFTDGLKSGGVDVATAADLKSIEDSAWRPLTLENANNGTILFKDNGDGTALLTGSANFVIAADSGVITEAINPPSGYQFSSLAWNKGVNGDGIFAIGGRSGTSGGSIYTPSALINNGKICFKGGSFSYPELMFSPCLNTTDKTSSSCEPAIVEIKKV